MRVMMGKADNLKEKGFTLMELVVVLTLFSIGTSIGVGAVGGAMDRTAVRGANRSFSAIHARARSHAVQRGVQVHFIADAAVDSVWINEGDSTVAAFALKEDLGVDLQSSPQRFEICMNARGLSDRACNSFSAPIDLSFVRGAHSAQARVQTFGQLAPL